MLPSNGRGILPLQRRTRAITRWLHLSLNSNHRAVASYAREILEGQRKVVGRLWQQFFLNPSQWWDHRSDKVNPRYPDFKHKKKKLSLWLNDKSKPPWVEQKLAAISPGTLQCSIFSWNKKLSRYAKAGDSKKILELFRQIQGEGISPDKFTFIPVLNACSSLEALEEGRHIHTHIISSGCESDVIVGNCLVDMYAKCGSIGDARRVFDRMATRDTVSWNSMIQGYVKCGNGHQALKLSQQMHEQGVDPDSVTFVGMVNACASITALEEGRHVHQQIIQRGHESDIYVSSCLIDMYTKCGSIEDAWGVFRKMPIRNVVAWSAMILGCVKCGQGRRALEVYWQMHQEGVEPNHATFIGVLKACGILAVLDEGQSIHEHIIRRGCESHAFVASCLVDMYVKCGSLKDAERVFSKMRVRDVVAWSAMILGYVKCDKSQKALELSRQMLQEGVDPDPIIFVGMLNACANVAALEEGRCVHEQIIRSNYESDVFLGSSLIDMYAKCGSIEEARGVFNKLPIHNVVSWNAMLGGYAMHGHVNEALQHFKWMCDKDVDGFTFISLLSACSHGGLANEGLEYFESMTSWFGIIPTVEHYTCVIDLLGRAGHLHQAEELIMTMPCEPNATLWRSLLGACTVHGNLIMGEHVAERVLELDIGNAAGHVLLSNMYAAAGKWDSSVNIRRQRLERGMFSQGAYGLRCTTRCIHSHPHPQIVELHVNLGII